MCYVWSCPAKWTNKLEVRTTLLWHKAIMLRVLYSALLAGRSCRLTDQIRGLQFHAGASNCCRSLYLRMIYYLFIRWECFRINNRPLKTVLLLQINRQKPCENNYISLVWILTSKHFFSTGRRGEERVTVKQHAALNFVYVMCACLSSSQVGSFFMINLCLVVIATQFSETKQREHQLMQEQRARCSSSSTLASEPGDCYEELFQLVCHFLRKARRQTVALFNTLRGKPRGFHGVGRGRGGGEGRERKANGREGRDRRAGLRHGT